MQAPRIAIVAPCYNEEQMLPLSIPVLLRLLDDMVAAGVIAADSYVMLSDDGSRDATWAIITEAHKADSRIKGISLAHNRGQQAALLAGLLSVREQCDAAITIDIDLQDDPGVIPEMVRLMREEHRDVVYGVRASRATDTWFKRTSARAFYKMQRSMGLETIYDHADFRLMSRKALDMLSAYGESHIYLRGLMPAIGLPSAVVKYDRSERAAGDTKYPFSRMLSLSIDGITSFTARPMRLILVIGIVLLLIDIAVALYVLMSYFGGNAVSGWSSLMVSVWFLGSLVLIALGIIGEYVGKIFIEVKHRPRYAIKERLE
ncbi:MAG: glycosyltransferase family 2 protein [Muribaculaceae bacterium]